MSLVKLRIVPTDEHDSMRGDALEKMIEDDIDKGLYPFLCIATLGTTSQCAFDNLEEIGVVCKKFPSMWLHVDGAYAGNSFVVPEMRKFKVGMEYVDSFDVNPSKLLMTCFDCTCLWVKNVYTYTAAFAIDPLHLQHQHASNVVDLRHFGTPLSRRFRSLKLYFLFRLYGLEGLQEYMRRVISNGQYIERLIKADKRFEVCNEVHLGLVCFRLLQPDSVNQELLARLNASAKIHLTPAKVKGKFIIRFVAVQEYVNSSIIDNAWKTIKKFTDELMEDVWSHQRLTVAVPFKKMNVLQIQRLSFSRNVSKAIFDKQQKL